MLPHAGRSSGSILTTGPTITIYQSGRMSAICAKQVGVEALVDHAVEAETRTLQVRAGRSGWLARGVPSGSVTRRRRREAMDAVVAVLLRFVEARAASEDEVGAVDKLLLKVEQLFRGEAELRKLVHAVVDDDAGVEMPRKGSIIGV